MSAGTSTYTPKSGMGKWFDARLPLPRLMHDSFVSYPVPRNLNYAYAFGGILAIMLVIQIFENIGMTMGIMPITGIPLPFVSYGGSALLTTLISMGLVLSVHMRRFS